MNINKLIALVLASVSLMGCSAKNVVSNQQQKVYTNNSAYSAENFGQHHDEVTLILSFSGGGTRAAALSYGVLEALRDTTIHIAGQDIRLLDEVDMISSVSGGSFTAAYYGLYGEQTFDNYKETFLYHEVTDDLASLFLSPLRWFSTKTRTRLAEDYYKNNIFGDKTFADISRDNSPYIVINSTDLSTGTRFSFTQGYFDMLCSDLNSYSISSAVTASSAVPLLFTPVVIENRDDCVTQIDKDVMFDTSNYRNRNAVSTIEQYQDKEAVKYVHLVDGGITDNLGLVAVYEMVEYLRLNKSKSLDPRNNRGQIKPLIIISVDAATNPELGIADSIDTPDLKQTVDAITDIQLHRYNDSTKDLMIEAMHDWGRLASEKGDDVTPYFVEVSFTKTLDRDKKFLLNQIRTDFNLSNDNVDLLVDEGYQQLNLDSTFQEFIHAHSFDASRSEHSQTLLTADEEI
ncbi:patatin-like phospholipase family protein [Vibrio comitans]|uniref:Lipoprotein n=1 Tax=Vibrio comitans NBRC 102076 TaxID=1219078 RepID=A0A4Y3IS25_9VIBR|nr:patatin-like phospholipase family protein [Vibrio comitans]GEA61912.1 lipoprotein [Vibrio comitans NBRC 102076]